MAGEVRCAPVARGYEAMAKQDTRLRVLGEHQYALSCAGHWSEAGDSRNFPTGIWMDVAEWDGLNPPDGWELNDRWALVPSQEG